MVYIAFELIRHTCVLVFQSKEPNVCTHGHLAQTVSVKIELVVNPVSKVLHNITASQLAALTSYYTVVTVQSYLINSLELLQRLSVLFPPQEAAQEGHAAQTTRDATSNSSLAHLRPDSSSNHMHCISYRLLV